MGKAKHYPQYVASIIAALGAFSLGTCLAWANVVRAEFRAGGYHFPCNKEEFSWVGSSFIVGCMFVCIPSGFFINMIGRKWTLIVMCIPFSLGWVIVIFAPSLMFIYIARFMLGFSGGSYSVSIPVYTGEIAQREVRGLLGSLFQFMLVCGILFMYTIGAILHTTAVSTISAVVPVVLGVLMCFMPESPIHLIHKGKIEDAAKSYAWLRGKDYDATTKISNVMAADADHRAHPVSIPAAFKRSATITAFMISAVLMILLQLSGINVVVFYSTDIFLAAHTGMSAAYSTVMIGVVQLLATFASMVLVDRLGRRTLLLVSANGMAISTFCIGIYFHLEESDPETIKSLNWLPVTSLCAFIAFFSIGFGPIPWIIMGEIFPTDIKGFAGSIAATLNWICAFIVTKTFVNLREAVGTGGAFWVFTSITVAGIFFVWFVLIETKGKSLGEIQAELKRNSLKK